MDELGGKLHFPANIWAVSTFRLFRGASSISPDLFISPKTNFPALDSPMLHILQARPGLIIDVEEGTLKVSSAQLQSRVCCTMPHCQYFDRFSNILSRVANIFEYFIKNCQYVDRFWNIWSRSANILTDFQIFYQLQHDVKLLWGWTLNKGMDTVSFCWGFYMTHSPYCLPFKHMGQKLQ